MAQFETFVEVDVPLRKAYAAWTHWKHVPSLMEGIESVELVDDRSLRWRTRMAGRLVEWTSEIVERVPDRRIAWKAQGPARRGGVVSFEAVGPRSTRISLALDDVPGTSPLPEAGDPIDDVFRRVAEDLTGFERFMRSRSPAPEARRPPPAPRARAADGALIARRPADGLPPTARRTEPDAAPRHSA